MQPLYLFVRPFHNSRHMLNILYPLLIMCSGDTRNSLTDDIPALWLCGQLFRQTRTKMGASGKHFVLVTCPSPKLSPATITHWLKKL